MSSESPLDPPSHEPPVGDEVAPAPEAPADPLHDAPQEEADPLLDPPQEAAGLTEPDDRIPSTFLPEIYKGRDLEMELDLELILSASHPNPESDKVKKRASNVLKLSQENEKLKAELKAMSDRLEAAERRRVQLARKQQQAMEEPEDMEEAPSS